MERQPKQFWLIGTFFYAFETLSFPFFFVFLSPYCTSRNIALNSSFLTSFSITYAPWHVCFFPLNFSPYIHTFPPPIIKLLFSLYFHSRLKHLMEDFLCLLNSFSALSVFLFPASLVAVCLLVSFSIRIHRCRVFFFFCLFYLYTCHVAPSFTYETG